MKTGFELLDDAFLNKGTAFTESERKKLGLEGLLPPCVEDIETQAQRIYRQMERKTSLIEKRRFLMEVFNFNRTLFFHVFSEHLVELMPSQLFMIRLLRRASNSIVNNLSTHSMQRSFPSIIRNLLKLRLNRLPETERSVLLLLLMQKAFLALVTGVPMV